MGLRGQNNPLLFLELWDVPSWMLHRYMGDATSYSFYLTPRLRISISASDRVNFHPAQSGYCGVTINLGQVSTLRNALIFCTGGEHCQQSIAYPHQPLLIIGSIILGIT